MVIQGVLNVSKTRVAALPTVAVMVISVGLLASCSSAMTGRETSFEQIDAEAKRLMATEDVKGMALAVIEKGDVIHTAAYGHRNVANDLPLNTDTVMYNASFTKTAFAYLVLQLIDEGRLELDQPLADYLDKPIPAYRAYRDLEGDDRWRKLTARHVLNHATGFANFRWLVPDRKLRFYFDPGERYGYSGEGFHLLQFVLEEGLGLDIDEEMDRRVFRAFDMDRTGMTWRNHFTGDVADSYNLDGEFIPYDKRDRVSAAGSMYGSINDQARMWSAILRGDGLSGAARAELTRPQFAIDTAHQFPSLIEEIDPRGPAISLSAGLGLITYQHAGETTWFKGGHDEGTGNMVVCQETAGRCVVLMANSVRAEKIYPQLVRFILGDTGMPWWWEYHTD